MARLNWNRELAKLAVVFGAIYFVQGMSNLPGLPISYLIKNVMKLNESQAQLFGAATSLAWFVKPIWGYISDNFPVLGYRRKSYLIGMSLSAAASWFALAAMAHYMSYGYWALLIMFNVSAAAYAFVDVVCDGLMVENGKRAGLIDQFVNVQWFGMGVAGVVVGYLSGYFSEVANKHIEFYQYIFAIAGLVPLLTAILVVSFVREDKTNEPFPWRRLWVTLAGVVFICVVGLKAIPVFLGFSIGARILVVFFGFLAAAFPVWKWAGKPRLFWTMNAFLFFWGFNPSVGFAQQYYQIDVLKFSEKFFGFLGSLDSVCWILGIIFYGFMLKQLPNLPRKIYLYYSIFLGVAGLFAQYLYYLAPGTTILGAPINYRMVAVVSSTMLTLLGMPAFLIPLSIAGDASKTGNEAITYAWFMSVMNFSGAMSSLVGGWLYPILQHTDLSVFHLFIGNADFLGDKANKALILRLFVWISALFTLFMIPLVYFVKIPESSGGKNKSTP